MTSETFSASNRLKLSGMMFLQYMLLPVWFVPLGAYLENLQMSGSQMALILNSMALGCLTSPLVGMVADRHFASERVLATLNLLTAILLVVAASMTSATMVFILLLAVMLCQMPTWGLTSAIAMAHSPSEKFPQIRVFGSIGWVASGLFSYVASLIWDISIDGTAITLYCGAATALVAAAFALTLPHTAPPAKGQKTSVLDALGLRSVVLLRDFQFAIFMICYFLIMIPFAIYWSFGSVFLKDKGFEFITITMNWGQAAEMLFMLTVPVVLARVGVKWAMTIGLAMLVVRYAAFLLGEMLGIQALYFVAILVHGLIFGFFFVGGQIYVDRKAPKELKAQAQGFLFLAGFGFGLFAGNFVNGVLIDQHSSSFVAVENPQLANAVFSGGEPTVTGASVSDIRVYSRILNEKELAVLTAVDDKQEKKIRGAAGEEGVAIDLENGLELRGNLDAIAGKPVPDPVTFSVRLTLPEKKAGEVITGTLFEVGPNLRLTIQDNTLIYQANGAEIPARRLDLPFAAEGKTESVPIVLAGTYNGSEIQMYARGSVYKIYDWEPVWLVTTICSVVLFFVFMLLFHDSPDTESETAESESEEDVPEESAPE